ncbi:MAG: transporter [Muribaculaceae bacterium]|nr:transporter [Muribaculaceae bacterium]
MSQKIKNLMLPLAMVSGAVFHKWMGELTFLSPYLIFMMLFITYCKLRPGDFKPHRMQAVLLTVQMLLAAAVYGALTWWNHTLAEGVFICVYIPTATAAPVITSMLGGSISSVATFSLISNLFVALTGPIVLAAVGDHAEYTFIQSMLLIMRGVFPLLLLPLAAALGVRYILPKLHSKLVEKQQISFYLWAVSLVIVVGSCVSFAISHWRPDNTWTMILLALGALAVCLIQFKIGRMVGGRYGDKVSGGQGLGQKNTVLAVWLALAYMHPIASIAPAAYIAWQNIINSWQLVRHRG